MKLDISIINEELIKPSSPTPDHLRRYQLSFLDQISPPVFMPLIFFYPKHSDFSHDERCEHIKKSLSETLARFYPLSGRLDRGNTYIECNDEGVHYTESRANCTLSRILKNPNPNEFNKFLPFELYDIKDLLLAVQVTVLDCGGLALGIAMCHKVCDALSNFMFIRSWAGQARGQDADAFNPNFDAAALFPPMDLAGFNPSVGIVKEKIVNKRFVFANSVVESLRDKYSDKAADGIQATRVEALSVFIWSRFMASTASSRSDQEGKIYALLHAVNLRSHADPPISDNVFGNLFRIAVTVPLTDNHSIRDQEDSSCHSATVKQIREEKKKIDAEYVKKLQQREGHLSFIKEMSSSFSSGDLETFNFTSLCRFPVYEADFGWGKPSWVASAVMSFKNLVTFLDTKEEDGVEAWINLEKNDMVKFEADEELLSHVSRDPSASSLSEYDF